jgi:hypothetical protein
MVRSALGPPVPSSTAGRPLTRLSTCALAAHVFVELAAGVGMPGASVLGPARAGATWATGFAVIWRSAGARSTSAERALALWNGFGAAAVGAHLIAWPTRRTRIGLPWLCDCEGLGPELMRVYNPILYVSGVAAAAAIVRENRSASRLLPILAMTLTPALAVAQRVEHRRLRAIADQRPAWWNRRLQER